MRSTRLEPQLPGRAEEQRRAVRTRRGSDARCTSGLSGASKQSTIPGGRHLAIRSARPALRLFGAAGRSQLLLEERHGSLEREVGGLLPPGIARRLGKPMPGSLILVDRDIPARISQRLLESVYALVGLVRILLGEMSD